MWSCNSSKPRLNFERGAGRSNESGGEFALLQEMTGRKPEGGEEGELIQLFHTQGEQKQRLQGPLGA